ncbi:MAG: glycosyltransferase [Bacteroidota bacterium]
MNILLSAFACAPNFGSELAAGWNFAEQLALQGHRVVVLTHDESKSYIERYSGKIPENLSFIYYRLPLWFKKIVYRGVGPLAHIYYFFWQIGSFVYLKRYLKHEEIDLIHLVTIGVFRTPVFLGLFSPPFVLGPVGGGEYSTSELAQALPMKYRMKEVARHFANMSVRLNPLMYLTYSTADLILLRTSDNLRYIPKRYHAKCKVSLEVGAPNKAVVCTVQPMEENEDFKILFAGRLEYWKGIHLAVRAFAEILRYEPLAVFTIVGSGSDEHWIHNIAKETGVYDKIEWITRIPQEELFKMYQNYDIFLFPSLHDSGGYVVTEALSFGLPVMCLDLGGPKERITNQCGIIIKTENKTQDQIIQNIGEELIKLIENTSRLSDLKDGALQTAIANTWEKVVRRIYSLIKENIESKEPQRL